MTSLGSAKVHQRLTATVCFVLTAIVLSSGGAVAGPNGSVEEPVDAGRVTITQPDDPARPIASGDSNTVFSLTVPDGASCPGDSFHDEWRVQSFIVPATDDPGELRYGVIWPEGEGRRSLYTAATMPFSHALVGKSDGPGEPGLILQPGPMTFAVYTAGLFPAGSYRIGLACTQFRETAAFWDTEIVIEDAPEVEPGRFTWSVVDTPSVSAAAQSDSNWSGAWIVALVGLVLLGGAVGISRNRRSTHSHMTPKEQS